ncbi:MAG: plastocyanin/azurin family copper-binding protein [Alphaproteobacteria bacterium]
MPMIRKSIVILALGTCITATEAAAEDVIITQQDKAFSEEEVTIKAGDSVTFMNNDSTTHNVYSRSKGNQFDSGAQGPNESMTQVFSSPGKVKVRCAIHPRMKLTVNVE